MARESQGLQVLLIVFVMLTVVLGVTTYLYCKRADEATKAVAAANSGKQQVETEKKDVEKERDDLKRWIGFPTNSTEEIHKQVDEDMQAFGNEKKPDAGTEKAGADKPSSDAGTIGYHNLVASMHKVIQDRTDELVRSRGLVADLETRFKNREAAKDKAIETLTASYTTMQGDVKQTAETYSHGLEATLEESKRTISTVARIKSAADQATTAAAATVTATQKSMQEIEKERAEAARKLNELKREQMDVPSGEITWVSLPNKLVWINRGRADSLQRQTRFTVYSGESSGGPNAVKKGTVEVTRIEGDHMAQARILDDKLADPIMAGDKVFTPLWSPGQRNHFALTGIMNIDGDGRNQLNVVRQLIDQNGGEVDCWLDERGHKQGQVTSNTRFIVKGDAPDKGSTETIKNHGDILRDAEHYQAHTITLPDFKQQMGYQKSSSVEHFGTSAPSVDAGKAPGAPKAPAKPPKAAAPKSDDSGT